MKTWVRVESGIIKAVIVAADKPAGNETWLEYPYPCDLAGPGNIAGTNIDGYDSDGNTSAEY